MEPRVLDRIAEGIKVSVERATFPAIVADRQLFALSDDSYWLDTGTPQAYLEAHADILNGTRLVNLESPLSGTNWISPSADVADSELSLATIDANCAVRGATITNSVLLPGARVAAGAVVRDSIVGPGATVEEGVVLEATCVIGHNVTVPKGSVLRGDVRLGGPQ
jgi:mannose-1-phosphate guanylyltransferase